ncbi:ATP-binding protein [Haloferax sp. DFSO60]|uniref:sensor histidine kinase n=1 Tax=Haloferax sp. DFSO60 TaxID=3388652 RepID=UPI00397B016E
MHQPLPRKQALARVLEIGTRYLGIEHGHITDIDKATDQWEVVSSTDSPDGPYPEGLTAELSNSYCRRTVAQSRPVALNDAGNQGWADDYAYQLHRLDTYLGIRIDVFGEPYGTMCFVARESRDGEFTEVERIFIELAGEVTRQVLERFYHQKDLANRDRLISVLNRVLRHNLRNDLNVVNGYAQLLESRTSGDEKRWSQIIGSTTTGLLATAEKSRKLEQLTRTVPVTRPTDIVPVVHEAVDETNRQHPAVEVALTAPKEAVTFASPEFADAVTELLDNAATYSGSEPTIEVMLTHESDETVVRIDDDGPGLPVDEQQVLTGGAEEPLTHGSGLGLALVFWIITNLDGTITVDATPSGTTVELRLQSATSISSSE